MENINLNGIAEQFGYNASYLSFMDWYNRTHMPKQRVTHFRL